MRKRIVKKIIVIGTFVCMLLISIILPAAGTVNNIRNFKDDTLLIDYFIYDNKSPDFISFPWWTRWPDFPGRYEPMFDVHDVIELGQSAYGLSSADFNDDGLIDFAVSSSTDPFAYSTISIFYNDGELGFTQDEVNTFYTTYINDLDSGDYDLDGDIDLMFTYCNKTGSNDDGFVNLLLNDGENNFGNLTTIAELIEGNRINPQLTSADFDNDGDIDFLVGDNSGLVEFFKNDGTGNFISAGLYDFGKDLSWGLSSADFDNDGDIDFIVTQYSKGSSMGYIYLVCNDGSENCFNESDFIKIADISYQLQQSFFATASEGFGCLQSIDYNDDGKMDFLFSGSDSIFLFMQKGIGVFDYFHIMRLPGRFPEEGGGLRWYTDNLRQGGIATGDFNNDNLDDIVIGGAFGIVRFCINNLVLVDIVKPDRTNVFISNEIIWGIPLLDPIMIYSFIKHGKSIAIGDLTIEVKALEPLQKVEFYLGNKLMHTDDSEPFEWNWNSFSMGERKIKAIGYDLDGEQVGFDDTIVRKFF